MASIPWVDHVMTDPPYSELVHSKSRAGARKVALRDGNGHVTRCAIAREREFGFTHLTAALREACALEFARLARRWVLCFSDCESVHMWREDLTDAGLRHARTGYWLKLGGTPQFTGLGPGVAVEAIEISHSTEAMRWNGGGKLGVWPACTVQDRGGAPGSGGRVHTAQKPEDLLTALELDFTDPDDLILDPFAGSGTTGVAALRLGRRVILIEKDPKYAAICVERMRAEESGSTLQAQRAGQVPMFGGGNAG